MLNKDNIKGVLLDYGGTIDTNGIHWAEVLWSGYEEAGIPVGKDAFDNAYVHGERTLGKNSIILPNHNFLDLLRIKVRIQLDELFRLGHLSDTGMLPEYSDKVACFCYQYAKHKVEAAKPILAYLSEKYPLVLVSNFYGNIQTVLEDFGARKFFKDIVESAVVGVRKPDSMIFTLGAEALGLSPGQTVVVGDSFSKDIEPARKAGCRTIWLNVSGWKQDIPESSDLGSVADVVISDFNLLGNIL